MTGFDGLVGGGAALRAAREQLQQIARAREALDTTPAGKGASLLCVTTSLGSYPTVAQAVYAMTVEDCDADDTEGAIASYTGGDTIFAVNFGTQVPPQGTRAICHSAGGAWCFRWDGSGTGSN